MENWASYDVVLLGCPIWWGIPPKITRTFAESYDWSVKTVAGFCTSGGSAIQQHGSAGADGGCGLAGGQAFFRHSLPRRHRRLAGGPAAAEAPAASLSETAETAAALPDAERQTSALPEPARLKNMNLNRLRQLARTMDGLSMTEEAIASADKKSLIAAITRALRKIEE